jgi:sulfur transfer complex TusBCD TusB component (DsrH family)
MKKIVHVVKKSTDPYALEIIAGQAEENAVSVVVIQEGVRMEPDLPSVNVFALEEDAAERKIRPKVKTIGYEGFLELILEADAVVTW